MMLFDPSREIQNEQPFRYKKPDFESSNELIESENQLWFLREQ